MKKQFALPFLCILIIAACASSCSKEYSAEGFTKPTPVEDSFNLTINFTPMVDTLKLHFDSTYKNFWKEPYKVSAFKFYVCKFDLINTDSNRTYHLNKDKYFLVDAADSSTWAVKLLASPFIYNRISFLIGVDSAGNAGGKHNGALDSLKGMFISSAAGYKMAELQGSSVTSGKKMDYRISGYTGIYNVLRTPVLLFPFGQYLQITTIPGRKSIINVNADVNAWFFNPHQIKIEDNPSCTTPGMMAQNISENYSRMFTVMKVINN